MLLTKRSSCSCASLTPLADSPVDTRDADRTGPPVPPYEGIFLEFLTGCDLDVGC